MSRSLLVVEFTLLFTGLPLAYRFSPRAVPALPALWLACIYCWWQLMLDPTFPPRLLWNPQTFPHQWWSVLGIFLVVACLVSVAVRLFAPRLLFGFVRDTPDIWAIVMVFYPVLSVYPQGLIYRSFLMHRYAAIIPPGWPMIVTSAAAFAFMHLIFRNWLAVASTFFGGLLFAWRYNLTGSLFTSAFEHALYGCWIFTIGLGMYFYHGRIRLSRP